MSFKYTVSISMYMYMHVPYTYNYRASTIYKIYVEFVHKWHLCSFVLNEKFCEPSNNGAVAKLLVEGGADVNASDDRGAPPLSVAAACGYMDVVKVLLEQPEIDLDLQVCTCTLYMQLVFLFAINLPGRKPTCIYMYCNNTSTIQCNPVAVYTCIYMY